jgi:hypothetical protein
VRRFFASTDSDRMLSFVSQASVSLIGAVGTFEVASCFQKNCLGAGLRAEPSACHPGYQKLRAVRPTFATNVYCRRQVKFRCVIEVCGLTALTLTISQSTFVSAQIGQCRFCAVDGHRRRCVLPKAFCCRHRSVRYRQSHTDRIRRTHIFTNKRPFSLCLCLCQ